jgi:hypothetical protein
VEEDDTGSNLSPSFAARHGSAKRVAGIRVRGGPCGPPLPSEPGVQVSPHRAQALIRRREAPGDRFAATFTIGVCTGLTQSAHRAFNGTKGNHRLSNHSGLAVPHLSRDPRPVGSQPPFGAGHEPLSGRLQAGVRLLRHPIPPCPQALPYGSPSTIPVGAVGLTTFHTCTIPRDVGPALPPAVQHLRGGTGRLPDLTAYLLVHACQPLWHVTYHGGSTAIHVCWPYPSTLAPDRLEANSRNLASRFGCPRIKRRLRCPGRVAPRGYPRRTAR